MSNHNGNADKMVGEDHLPDAGKMVSDTPRTDDRVVFIDGNPWVNAPFARSLELELNAANDKIKRLEEAGDKMADMMILSARIIERESPSALAWIRAKEGKL